MTARLPELAREILSDKSAPPTAVIAAARLAILGDERHLASLVRDAAAQPYPATALKCICGRSAEWLSWRWNSIGAKTEEPFCPPCRDAVMAADHRMGVNARDAHGWQWERIEEVAA